MKERALPELEAAYKRGMRDGYALGLRDGQLTPDELKTKHDSMKTWIPKRRTDRPDWGVPHEAKNPPVQM